MPLTVPGALVPRSSDRRGSSPYYASWYGSRPDMIIEFDGAPIARRTIPKRQRLMSVLAQLMANMAEARLNALNDPDYGICAPGNGSPTACGMEHGRGFCDAPGSAVLYDAYGYGCLRDSRTFRCVRWWRATN